MEFVQARNYTKATGRSLDLIVMHDMEAPEGPLTAENVARYFQGPVQASAHYCVDNNSVVQCVLDRDVAWAAPGANHNGLQVELAGYARQSAAEWDDAYSRSMLSLAALLVADLCRKYNIPAVFVSARGLIAGERGITTHANVSAAFKRSNHSDPGVNFPMDAFLTQVREALKPPVLRDWPVPLPKWFWEWASWRLNDKASVRPSSAPYVIPPWAWVRLKALQAGRN